MKSFRLSFLFLLTFMIGNAQIIDIPDAWFKGKLISTQCVDTDGDGIRDSDVDTNNDGEIQVSEAESVTNLWMSDSFITSFEGLQFFTNLERLELFFMHDLQSLDVTYLTNLEYLNVSNNLNLENLGITGLSNLQTLICQRAPVSNLDLSMLSGLEYLDTSFCDELTSIDLNGLVNLQHIDTNNCDGLTNISLNGLVNLEYLDVRACIELTSLNLNDLTSLIHLDANSCQNITSLNLSALSNLEFLDLQGFQLTSLDISASTNLNHLNLSVNRDLVNLNINGLSNLEYLNLTQNYDLIEFDLSDFVNLEYLQVPYCNQFTSLNLNGLVNLEFLDVTGLQLTSLDLTGLISLKELDTNQCSSLLSLDLSDLVNLEEFRYSNSLSISSLDFSQNPNLIFVNIYNTNLNSLILKNGASENLSINTCDTLEYVCADDNEIEEIQLALDNLGCSNVTISTYCSFSPGGTYYLVEGENKVDTDSNGCDINDNIYPNLKFNISDGVNNGMFFTNTSTNYSIPLSEGDHTLTPELENSDYFIVLPSSISVNFPSDTSPFIQDFCITPNGVHNDLEITIIPLDLAIPGFDVKYKIIYKNKGNTSLTGLIEFAYSQNSDVVQFLSATPTNDSEVNNILSWNFVDLAPFEAREVEVTFNLNTPTDPVYPLNNGDELNFTAIINPLNDDETPSDNTFELNQIVVNSYDPNDITCLEGETISPEDVGKYVHYLIRFENLGTANATNIVVNNAIDATKLDVNTLVPLDGSHDYITRINSDNDVEFIFENIQLPFDDANNDGYIAYKIKTLESLVLGDTFSNQAEIYFDFNAPIITNNYTTEVEEDTFSVDDFNFSTIKIYPNPVIDILNIESNLTIQAIRVFDIQGRKVLEVAQDNINLVDMSALNSGIYFVKVFSNSKAETIKVVKH